MRVRQARLIWRSALSVQVTHPSGVHHPTSSSTEQRLADPDSRCEMRGLTGTPRSGGGGAKEELLVLQACSIRVWCVHGQNGNS